VFDDANIDDAVEGTLVQTCDWTLLDDGLGAISCKFRANGQTCISANRIYVHSAVYAEFASRLAEKVAAFKVGDGLLSDRYVPSQVTRPYSSNFSVVTAPTAP